MSASAVKAGEAYVEIAAREGKLLTAMKNVRAKLTVLAAKLATTGKGFLEGTASGLNKFSKGVLSLKGMMGAALTAAPVAGLATLMQGFADAGGAIDDMSQRTGVAVESLSKMQYAAKMSGASSEDVEKAITKMGIKLTDAAAGSKSAVAALDAVGLSVDDLKGKSPEDQFAILAEGISKIEDPGAKAAAAMDIFGKSGANLIPMLNGGSAGLQDLYGEAERLGVVMSGEDAEAAAHLGDMMDTLWTVVGSLTNTIGAALAPALTDMLDQVAGGLTIVREFLDQNREWIVLAAKVAVGVALGGTALMAVAGIAAGVGMALSGLIAVAGVVGTAFTVMAAIVGAVLSPIGLVVVGVVAIGGAILYYSGAGGAALDFLGGKFSDLLAFAMPVFEGLQTALTSGQFGAAANVLWTTLEIAWRTGTQSLYGLWLDSANLMSDVWTDVTGAITDNFGGVINWLIGTWESAVNQIAKSLLYLYSLFDRSVDYEKAAKQMDADTQARQKQREAKGFASFADRAAAKGQRDSADQAKKDEFANRIVELKGQLQESLAGIEEEAERQRAEAEKQAEEEPTMADKVAGDGNPEAGAPTPTELDKQVKATTTTGTFSGFAAGLAGSSVSSFDRMIDESQKQTEQLKVIAANTAEDRDPEYGE